MFPHKSLWKLSYKDLDQRERALLAQYPAAQKEFLETARLPEEFVQGFINLIHPVFLPYLNYLAPKFAAALTPSLTAAH